jgi:hypothetical protein
MQRADFTTIDLQIETLGQHACHALLALDRLRFSPDPDIRLAYQEVHDLIGDIGALRLTIDLMPHDQRSPD